MDSVEIHVLDSHIETAKSIIEAYREKINS